MDDDGEHASLTGGRSPRMSRVMLGLIITILVFSFFAFVFATASYAAANNLNSGVQNNFYNQQGGLIEDYYTVSPGTPSFEAGQVVSYCDGNTPSGGICPGLGPRWNTTLPPVGSLSGAIYGDLVQISPNLAVYAYVSSGSASTIRVASICTSCNPTTYNGLPQTIVLTDPVSWLVVRNFSESGVVIAYTTHNTSYIVAAAVPLTTAPQIGAPVSMFDIPATNDDFAIDVVVLKAGYILVTYGQNTAGATFLAYSLSGTTFSTLTISKSAGYGIQVTNVISSSYLGNVGGVDYLFQSTGTSAYLSTFAVSGNTLTLSFLKSVAYENVQYESLVTTSLFNGYISLVGVQSVLLQEAMTVSMVVQWSTKAPYITTFFPSNLLEDQGHVPINNQISTCYAPASTGEPKGELFFAYVDSKSDRAKVIRAKIGITSPTDVQILPSPPIDISTFTYTQYGISIGPLLACPSASGVLVGFQYIGTFFNSFQWQGGYRFAGIVQEPYVAGSFKNVRVVRQGISSAHTALQPGFPYYVSNSGHLHSHTSVVELFSYASFNHRIGVALAGNQLLLDPNVFEEITYAGGGNK